MRNANLATKSKKNAKCLLLNLRFDLNLSALGSLRYAKGAEGVRQSEGER